MLWSRTAKQNKNGAKNMEQNKKNGEVNSSPFCVYMLKFRYVKFWHTVFHTIHHI